MEAPRETDGRKGRQRGGDQEEVDFHERGGDGRYRGKDGGARRSPLGGGAGELITLRVLVCSNIHVSAPRSVFQQLSAAFK